MPALIVGPLLAQLGVDAALVAGAILAIRIALFAHAFIKRGL